MALVDGTCRCECGCGALGWVDALTQACRKCEIDHGERWGHRTVQAEVGQQIQVDNGSGV